MLVRRPVRVPHLRLAVLAAFIGLAAGGATRDYDVILPLMLATVLAEMIARATLSESLMTEKLSRRNVTVPSEFRPDAMATTRVREVMTTQVSTLPASAVIADALEKFVNGRHSSYPIVNGDGGCVGVVSRSDLLAVPADDQTPLAEAFGGEVVTVRPSDTALAALHRMLDESVDHLPVVADGRLVGICTRTDVLRARQRLADAERRQPGWIARLRVGEG